MKWWNPTKSLCSRIGQSSHKLCGKIGSGKPTMVSMPPSKGEFSDHLSSFEEVSQISKKVRNISVTGTEGEGKDGKSRLALTRPRVAQQSQRRTNPKSQLMSQNTPSVRRNELAKCINEHDNTLTQAILVFVKGHGHSASDMIGSKPSLLIYLVPFALSLPSSSQKALKVVKSSLWLSRTHSAVAPTKYTNPDFTSSVFGPTEMVPSPLVQMKILGPAMASNVALAPFFFSSVFTTLNSSIGGSYRIAEDEEEYAVLLSVT